ncbi:MAG TPA: hypothetical protein VFZ08_01055 [Terriglobia bacterium]|nr:hypothetical protein [Terriglobia bacterium]
MLTFHKILQGCQEADAEAWRAFLSDYTPLVFKLAQIYMPDGPEPFALWQQALRELSNDDFRLLRTFESQSEREFLASLRAFFLDKGTPESANVQSSALPELTAGRLAALVKSLPLLHQQVLFLKLAGYSDGTLEKIFRITPAVAQKSLEGLDAEYHAALGKQHDRNLQPAAWLRLTQELRASRTETCPPLRQFIRIQDGQVGWQEKEPAERHLSECLHCLEAWTALLEISFWRGAAERRPATEIEALLSGLPVKKQPPESGSFLSKLLKRK